MNYKPIEYQTKKMVLELNQSNNSEIITVSESTLSNDTLFLFRTN